jgi:hypothetical protein
MKNKPLFLSLSLLLAFALAACNAQAATLEAMPESERATESAGEAMPVKDEEMMSDEMPGDESMDAAGDEVSEHPDDTMITGEDKIEAEDETMMEEVDETMTTETMTSPDWFKAALTDARNGESFTIAGFQGKAVLVETLAMWCSNCLKQQGQVLALHGLLGERDDFISLGIDIDPNENAAALQAYTNQNGFAWLYSVAPPEVAREIGQLYGDQFLNPPSTPMLIIDRHGEVHLLPFGIKSAESLLAALQPFLDGSM